MILSAASRRVEVCLAACLLALWAAVPAQAATAGQAPAGEIPTPYLPSTQLDVEEMLRVAGIGPQDVVVDLGSGDGRIVIAAAKYFGARGFGVDIDEKLVAHANDNARGAGVGERVRFYHRDIFATDLKEATVVTMYLLTPLVNRLQPKLLAELKPGARIVAHDYGFDNWKPDRTVKIVKTFYLYTVPAQVAGKWRMEAALSDGQRDFEFDLKQQIQEISGGATVPGGYLPLFEPRLNGERISFVIADRQRSHHFEGRVTGSLMEGTVRVGVGNAQTEQRWRATRVVRGIGEN